MFDGSASQMYNPCSECVTASACQHWKKRTASYKLFLKSSPWNALSMPELAANWSRVNVSELRQMRYQIGGQECDNQGIGERKLHQNRIISLARSEDLLIPDLLFQSWGFYVMRYMQWNKRAAPATQSTTNGFYTYLEMCCSSGGTH